MYKLREKTLKTLELCKEELEKRKNGVEGESTVEQLENCIIPELTQFLERIDKGEIPPAKEKRFLNSFANAFKEWGWKMKNSTEIFKALAELNEAYEELK